MIEWTGLDQMLEHPTQKVGCSSSVTFVVGIVIGFFDSFGFFGVLLLFGKCWGLFGDWTFVLWSLEVLWVLQIVG